MLNHVIKQEPDILAIGLFLLNWSASIRIGKALEVENVDWLQDSYPLNIDSLGTARELLVNG